MNNEIMEICKNCKYHYIEEISFDYPQSCCNKTNPNHTTEAWLHCDNFEYSKDYITNLQKENERLNTNYDIMQQDIQMVGKLLGLRDDFIISEEMPEKIKELQQKIKQYEDPDDLTLFYMWLDTKAKDKMKQLESEIIMLKQQNQIVAKLGDDYKSRCEKAIEYIKEHQGKDEFLNLNEWQTRDLLNILNGGDKE